MSVCASQGWGGAGFAALICVTLAVPVVASAQTRVGVWEPTSSAEARTPVDDEVPPALTRAQRVPRRGLVIAGATVLTLGYLGAVIWGSYFLADLQLGVPSCNDQYAGWHFLPIAGPLIGTLTGGQCIPDTMHFEEVLMPIIFTVGQLAGLALLVGGLIGHVVELPAIDVSASADGAMVRVGGTF